MSYLVRLVCAKCGKAWEVNCGRKRYVPVIYLCPECRPITGDESHEQASPY